MIAGRTRLAMRIRMRLGATADGQLLAKQTQLWADNGAYSGHGPTVAMAAAIRMDNLYRFEASKSAAQLVYTNNVPSECFRGFGSPQSSFAQEQLMDRLARRLDLDPFELRRRNVTQTGDTTIHGWQIGSCGIKQCLDAVSQRLDTHRKQLVAPDKARFRIGYGSAACIHGISNRGYDKRFDGANVSLRVERDGTLRIASGEVELGCGTVDVNWKSILTACRCCSVTRSPGLSDSAALPAEPRFLPGVPHLMRANDFEQPAPS
jgi:CO/xanthine dehydrogenase Mo-binding subunit